MKSLKLLLAVLGLSLFLSYSSSFAQSVDFQLKDYKNPDYSYKALNLGFDLNNESKVDYFDNGTMKTKNKDIDLNSTISAYYRMLRNTAKLQSDLEASGQFGGGYTLESPVLNSETRRVLSTRKYAENLSLSGYYRFFFRNKFYVEGSYDLSQTYENSEQNLTLSTSSSDEKTRYRNIAGDYTADLGLAFGFGRIECVQDAQMALYILNNLKEANLLIRQQENPEINELAKLISKLKYRRYFDSREQRIEELKTIDSFLKEKKLIGNLSIDYFTTVSDQWSYANNPIRYSGTSWYLGAVAFSEFNSAIDKTIPLHNSWVGYSIGNYFELLKPGIKIGMRHEKPLNLKWQNSIGLEVRMTKDKKHYYSQSYTGEEFRRSAHNYAKIDPDISATAEYGFGYYPNTRTWITASWNFSATFTRRSQKLVGETVFQKTYDTQYFSTGPVCRIYYYISPRMQLSGILNTHYFIKKDINRSPIPEMNGTWQSDHQLYVNFSAMLAYALF